MVIPSSGESHLFAANDDPVVERQKGVSSRESLLRRERHSME
jgi:hypothetical protein